MPIQDIGNNQNGPNAEPSYLTLNTEMTIPPGGILPVGYPVARNLLAGQGNLLSQFAAVAGLSAFANGDQCTALWLSGAPAASTGAGKIGGVWVTPRPSASPSSGGVGSNPWLNYPSNTINTSSLNQPGAVARVGLVPAWCGVVNGGTTVKVGDFVGKGATLGTTSLYPFLISSGGTTVVLGNTYGQVVASPIWSTFSAGVAAGSGIVAGVFNTNGMTTAIPLTINPGGINEEAVTPSAVTATAPAVAAFTVAGTAGAASTIQLTFNLGGYQGSASGTGPTGTLTTAFTLSIANANGNTATQTATAVYSALIASGFCFGMSQNILGVGAGSFVQQGTSAGAPNSGPLIYVTQSAGVLTFSAAMPGAWANTLLTYTVTVLSGVTQTFNTNVSGSATAVAFASGVSGTFTATFSNAHSVGEPVIGIMNTSQGVIIPAPGTAGMLNTGLCMVSMAIA